jgi:hypothetical protein
VQNPQKKGGGSLQKAASLPPSTARLRQQTIEFSTQIIMSYRFNHWR